MACMTNGEVLDLRNDPKVFILNIKKSGDTKKPNDVMEVYLKPGFVFNTPNIIPPVNAHKLTTITGTFIYIADELRAANFCYCPECRKGIVESALRNDDMSYLTNWKDGLPQE